MAMADDDGGDDALRELQRRGAALWTAVTRLPSHVLTPDCRARLLKAAQAERNFVDRLAAQGGRAVADAHLSSSNFGHLEGILFVLRNQSWGVAGAGAALKSFRACSLGLCLAEEGEVGGGRNEASLGSSWKGEVDGAVGAHVDLVCTLHGEAVWVVVVNSRAQNRLWFDKGKRKGLHTRLSSLLHVATLVVSAARPSAIVLLVRDGFESRMEQQLEEEFQATRMCESGLGPHFEGDLVPCSRCTGFHEVEDGEWVNIHLPLSRVRRWTSYWIRVTSGTQGSDSKCMSENLVSKHELAADSFLGENGEDLSSIIGSSSCWAAIARLQAKHEEFDKLQQERKILNLDTTALVAIVSELTNGGAKELLEMSPEEREKRFPAMAKFVCEQALGELDEPFISQFEKMLSDKLPVICEYVYDEFTSIILTNGGSREKQRAQLLLSQLKVVANVPSARVDALPETGKIKPRHKLVFGSGDFLQAPTVTANMSFVRAVQQQGMALAVIQHQPCALTGD